MSSSLKGAGEAMRINFYDRDDMPPIVSLEASAVPVKGDTVYISEGGMTKYIVEKVDWVLILGKIMTAECSISKLDD